MIDMFSIVLTHGLMLLAGWYLLKREDLDADPIGGDGDDGQPVASKRAWNQKG